MSQNSGVFARKNSVMSCATYAEAICGVIQREYGPLKHAAEILARHARTSPRTAENWLAGTHAPNGEKLINLMSRCDAVADEIFRLAQERKETTNGAGKSTWQHSQLKQEDAAGVKLAA